MTYAQFLADYNPDPEGDKLRAQAALDARKLKRELTKQDMREAFADNDKAWEE